MSEEIKEDFGGWTNYETLSTAISIMNSDRVLRYLKDSFAIDTPTHLIIDTVQQWSRDQRMKEMNKGPIGIRAVESFLSTVDWELIIEKARTWE
jgi:hypothetical protein